METENSHCGGHRAAFLAMKMSGVRILPNTILKKKLQIDLRSKWKDSYYETLEEKSRTCSDIKSGICDPPLRFMKSKTNVNKWDLINIKSICTAKETIIERKRQPSEWKVFLQRKTLIGNLSLTHTKHSYSSTAKQNKTKKHLIKNCPDI